MGNTADNATKEYGDILRHKIGNHLEKLILFGSQARGHADDDSDYDVLVVVDKRTDVIREMVLDAGVEIMNRYEKLFAAIIYDRDEWKHAQNFPLAWNIQREGILL